MVRIIYKNDIPYSLKTPCERELWEIFLSCIAQKPEKVNTFVGLVHDELFKIVAGAID